MAFSNITFAVNSNTFTFTNSGITASDTAGNGYKIEGNSLTISEPGTYTITGSSEEGSIKVKKETTGVTLILKDLTLSSSTTAPISLNKSTETTIEVLGTVTLIDKEDATTEETNEDFEGACIKLKSGGTLNIKGTGTLNIDGTNCKNGIKGGATSKITIDGSVTFNIKAANNGLSADGSMVINNGTFNVEAEDAIKCDPDDDDLESLADLTINGGTYKIKANSDGVRANSKLEINGGTFDITSEEGMEATYVLINDGTINISATDDGINGSDKSTRYSPKVEINGGNITIKMGQGDTDAVDVNGELVITGGTIDITGQSAFDFDKTVTFTGGDVTVNGQKITTITNQMMGGRGGQFGGRNGMQNNGQMTPPDGNFENMPQGFNRQGGRQIQSGEFNGQKPNRQNFNNQNGTQMTPPAKPEGEMPSTKPDAWSKASTWALEELTKAEEDNLIPYSLNGADFTQNITREQFAHVVVRLYEALTKKSVSEVSENPFTDTKDSEVLKAYSLGITKGTSSTTFSPTSLITREEMATMMTRALEKAGIDVTNSNSESKFADDEDMHDWGKPSIYYMASKGIIKGVTDNRFDVKGNATIEQALLISERAVNS